MAEFDRMEDRLRRTFRWVATNSGDDRGARGVPDGPGGRDRSGGDPDSGLYLDDPPPARQGRRIGRTTVLIGVAAVLVAAAGVPLGLVAASTGGGGGSGTHGEARTHHSKGPTDAAAKTQVVSALGATTNAGNWDISYKYSEVLGSNESAVPSTGVVCSAGSPCAPVATPAYHQPVTVTGSGVIDVNPKAMVTTADVSDFGRVVVRLNSTTVWEDASGDSGALALDAPNSASGGQSLPGYAGLVEGTLGTREGAVAMLGLGSPNGYLELVQNAIVGVSSTGTGTVDGKAVSQYHVSVQPAQLADDPSASPEEVTTIQNAVSTLQTQGLSGTTADVSVDAQGFIVRSVTTYRILRRRIRHGAGGFQQLRMRRHGAHARPDRSHGASGRLRLTGLAAELDDHHRAAVHHHDHGAPVHDHLRSELFDLDHAARVDDHHASELLDHEHGPGYDDHGGSAPDDDDQRGRVPLSRRLCRHGSGSSSSRVATGRARVWHRCRASHARGVQLQSAPRANVRGFGMDQSRGDGSRRVWTPVVEVVGRGDAARTAGLIAVADSLALRRVHLGDVDPANILVAEIVTDRGEGLAFSVRRSVLRRGPWRLALKIRAPAVLRIRSGIRRSS